MSTLVLAAASDAPHYDFSSTLEGKLLTLELRWNERSGAWFLALYDDTGAAIFSGRRVVLGADLLGRSSDARLPPGTLIAYDTSGANHDAGRDDLGTRVQLLYVEST
jgi:hypothetical protein